MKTILSICSGNRGRSPFAQYEIEEVLRKHELLDEICSKSQGTIVGVDPRTIPFGAQKRYFDKAVSRCDVFSAVEAQEIEELTDASPLDRRVQLYQRVVDVFVHDEEAFRERYIRDHGIDPQRIKKIQEPLVFDPDVIGIFGMGKGHVEAAYRVYRGHSLVIDTFFHFAIEEEKDVPDAFGGTYGEYEQSIDTVRSLAPLAAERLLRSEIHAT
ncbi:hypothetical protein J4464_03995 [Candidatus Woesearchaeota archaeon]|nr:hypothetical protein [Candidatus Woesearchaeota archaeon]